MTQHDNQVGAGLAASAAGMAVNLVLALIKIITGVVGNSYALIADGIESSADIVSSLIVWSGLKIAARPADASHPYGHGKAESLAALIVSAALLGAAGLIAWQSINEILTPHKAPAWYTLIVLGVVIVTKELLFRFVFSTASEIESSALKGDAWHHRSDAITSVAVFIGIAVALIGGERFNAADDWSALLACAVIAYNGLKLLRVAFDELMDKAAPEGMAEKVRALAGKVAGVVTVEKCRLRKYGLTWVVDIHVEVEPTLTVKEGHDIAHAVKDTLRGSEMKIADVLVHVEPVGTAHEQSV